MNFIRKISNKTRKNFLFQLGFCLSAFAFFIHLWNEVNIEEARIESDQTRTVKIAFVGDLIFQNELQKIALANGPSYHDFWSDIMPVFRLVDAVYGNVEGTLAKDINFRGKVVKEPTDFTVSDVYIQPDRILNFNYHRKLAFDMHKSGFRVVSTSNNHALDRGTRGVDQTIEHFRNAGIVTVGTRHSNEKQTGWGKVTRIGSMNIGWVACTYGTNGHSDPLKQVLDCYDDRKQTLLAIKTLTDRSDIEAVFFVPHWGIENHTILTQRQKALARQAIEIGATAVVGTHPHVLQEWQSVKMHNGLITPIIYSTGNFISSQKREEQRKGLILIISLTKNATQKATLSSIKYFLTKVKLPSGQVSLTNYELPHHALIPKKLSMDKDDLSVFLKVRRP